MTTDTTRPFTCSFVSITIEISDVRYGVASIDPGEFGSRAFRLHKHAADRAVYDVLRLDDGTIECSCPDYEFRHRGTRDVCKHGRALVELGLLAGPAPALTSETNWRVTSQAPRLLSQIEAARPLPCCAADEAAPCMGCVGSTACPDAATAMITRGLALAAEERVASEDLDDTPPVTHDEPFDPTPADDHAAAVAYGLPELDLAGLVEHTARFFEAWPTDAGGLIAEELGSLAFRIRLVSATTPTEFRERSAELEADARSSWESEGYISGLAVGRAEGKGHDGPLD